MRTTLAAKAGLFGMFGFLIADVRAAGQPGAATHTRPGDHSFFLVFGPGVLRFSSSATVRQSGAVIPGASVDIDPNTTLITELGYRRGAFGISLTGGIPPKARVDGSGTLESLRTLGRIRYGPVVLAARYTFADQGRFRPYVGAGPVFLLIFRNQDGAITHLDVANSLGAAIQLGAELELSPHWSLALDLKKARLRTDAAAELGAAPISAHIRLDPLVATIGLSLHF